MEPLTELSVGNTTERIGQGSSTEANLLTAIINSSFINLNKLRAKTSLGLSAGDVIFFVMTKTFDSFSLFDTLN